MAVGSQHSSPIKFGTDGWRAVIAEEFTYDQVARVAQASAQVLVRTYPGEGIVIGYDNRFLSEEFAQCAAAAIAVRSIPVILASLAAPTPALSWAAKQLGAHGALVITASHNPPQYSGIKVKGGFGGSVPPEVTQQIEAELAKGEFVSPASNASKAILSFDPWPAYLQQLSQRVDLDKIYKSTVKIWVDAMHGSAAGGMGLLLKEKIHELRGHRDPLFGGFAPEPLPPQLATTMQLIQADPASLKVGLVFDGDGDRIAAVDGAGRFLSPQILIPILIEHLAKRRGLTGEVVKTVSGSQLIDLVTHHYQLPLTETPIGFKYIAERMLATPVLLGGEESGGIGFLNHMPERDAMLSALYLLEAIAETGLDLSEIYHQIQAQLQFFPYYSRRDLHLKDASLQTKALTRLAQDPPTQILGRAVVNHLSRDGHKFVLEGNSWLMLRGSGTEPVLRLYCEAESLSAVESLLSWAEQWSTTV